MNIFLIMLISVFMAGYYMFFAPNTRVVEQETDHAVVVSDLRSVAECALAVHNAKIAGGTFDDVCVSQNDIKSDTVCLDSRGGITQCDASGSKRSVASYIITTTSPIDISDYNKMMEILEQNFATTGSFGVYQDGMILAGGTTAKRTLSASIQKQFNLENGQLVYLTHYEFPDSAKEFTSGAGENITCPAGTTKTYRFGRWQCIGYNFKTTCGGDMMWDYTLMECVPDETRKPLCAGNQTAVMVDTVWECVDPFADRQCPPGMVARLNYELLEWECVDDPNNIKKQSKCSSPNIRIVRGRDGATLRLASTSCTDCEKMLVDESTCNAICVPDLSKINSPACYPGRITECSGPSRALYFGFPNANYAANVPDLAGIAIPIDSSHSQNRKFNCMDCGGGFIDGSKSVYPYVAVCGSGVIRAKSAAAASAAAMIMDADFESAEYTESDTESGSERTFDDTSSL